jgi:uncharacterized membrane protein YfcA
LIGGGGSILTIPVLVYLFSFSPTLAISYSLFIIGFTSLVGAINNYRKGQVDFKTALLFGAFSISTVFITRKFIIPHVPDVFFTIGGFSVTHSMFVMVVFSILMLLASVSMIRGSSRPGSQAHDQKKTLPAVVLYSMAIGLITGFLGAGGGFLLIPTLVILLKLSMKRAIGTSLLIISLNCLVGFAGDLGRHPISWNFLLYFTGLAIAGIFAGGWLNNKVNSEKLRKIFGWFVLIMGVCILAQEILF